MTPERWQQVKHIFNAAVEQDPKYRPAFIAEACGADAELRSEVESLISSHEEDGSFIDSPAFEAAGVRAGAATLPAARLIRSGRAHRRGRHGRSLSRRG